MMYESKTGTDSYDRTDPRNDPRTREYWDIRRRTQTKEQIDFEKAFNHKSRTKERTLIRKAMLGLALGVFFGTIFPAIFLGADTETYYRDGCECDNCILSMVLIVQIWFELSLFSGKLRSNPTLTHLKNSPYSIKCLNQK